MKKLYNFLKFFLPVSIKRLFQKLFWFYHNHSLIHDFEKFKHGIYYGPITYSADGLVTCSNCDFIEEPNFAKAYAAAAATNPWPGFTLQWRVYTICWFANQAKLLEGDFVECGVNTGAYARAIIEYTNFNSLQKKFFLFDTFEGFVTDQVTEGEKAAGINKYATAYKDVYAQVRETFKDFNVQIVKGRVPETLTECQSEKICFLSIDMNAVVPEIAAITYFWPKLVKGAVIMLDDYGFPNHIHQKNAFDAFAQEQGLQVLSLPTGQGVLIK
jgi:hypothetical protein